MGEAGLRHRVARGGMNQHAARLGLGLVLASLATSAVAAPRIAVSPSAFDVSAAFGTTGHAVLRLANTGDTPLTVQLTPRGPLPDPGGLRPGETFSTLDPEQGRAPSPAPVASGRATRPWATGIGPQPIPTPVAARTALSGVRALILYAGGQVEPLRDQLRAFPEFQTVDIHDLAFSSPSLEQLQTYACVLVANASARFDPVATGDALADYVDGGGGLVLTLASFVSGYEIGGRLLSGGYIPFQLEGNSISGTHTLGTRDATHPILTGITDLRGELLFTVTRRPDATDVARWDNQVPLVATRPRVAAINLFVSLPGYAGGQVGELLRNALAWSVGQVDWLSLSSTRIVVAPGTEEEVEVAFDATAAAAGLYLADLVLTHDDPSQPELRLPVRFTVTGEPRLRLTAGEASQSSTVIFSEQGQETVHHLVVPEPHPDTLRLELTVEGDFGDSQEMATVSVEGRSLGVAGQVGGNCVTATRSFPLGRTIVKTLLADGVVDALVRNTALVDPVCATNHHTVRLRYERPGDVLRFDPVFVGRSSVAELVFHNTGVEILHVSGLSSSDGSFTVAQDTLTVAPRSQRALPVRFRPLVVAHATAMLTFSSDDAAQPSVTVRLEAEGLPPPDVDVSPLSIDARLSEGGSTERQVMIRNTGGSPLPFQLRARGAYRAATRPHGVGMPSAPRPPAAAQVASESGETHPAGPGDPDGERDRVAHSTEAGAVALLASVHSSMPGANVLLIQDAAPFGTFANENVLSGLGVAFDIATTAELDTLDLHRYRMVIIPSDQPTRSYSRLADHAEKLEDFVGDGGVLEAHVAGWGFNGGDAELLVLPGSVTVQRQTTDVAHIVMPDHPLAAGVPSNLPGTSAGHAWLRNLPPATDIVAVDEFGFPNLAVYSLGRGMVVATGLTLEFAQAFGQAAGPVLESMIRFSLDAYPHWLSFAPAAGEVPPGGQLPVTLRFQAGGLDAGDYAAEMDILSEDPDEARFSVPVSLHVDGAPDLEVLSRVVTGESRGIYVTHSGRTSHRIPVDRPRGGSLIVELEVYGDYGSGGEQAVLSVEGFVLGSVGGLGGDCVFGRRTFFLPSSLSDLYLADGVLELSVQNTVFVDPNCSTNEHVVRVSHAETPFPLRFRDTFVGGRDRRGFLLRNGGSAPLTVRALTTNDAQFRMSPETAIVGPRQELLVQAEFLPAKTGSLLAQLRVQTDDPDRPDALLTLSGRGIVAPRLETAMAGLSLDVFAGEVLTRETQLTNLGGAPLEARWLALADWHQAPVAAAADALTTGEAPDPPAAGAATVPNGRDSAARSTAKAAPLPSLANARARVLLVEDVAPWGRLTDEAVLDSLGIPYDRVPSTQFGTTDLTAYSLVILPADQIDAYYVRMGSHRSKLASWVEGGGVLEAHLAAWGSNNGEGSLMQIPGGASARNSAELQNQVEIPGHPLVEGVTASFSGTFASMGTLTGVPEDALVLTRDRTGASTLVLYRLGSGLVVAGTHPYEYGFNVDQASGRLLRNLVTFALAGSGQWLRAAPGLITVAPGASVLTPFTLDTRALEPGDYAGSLQLTTNDPSALWSAYPVLLRVANLHATLSLPDDALESGEGRRHLDVRLRLPSGAGSASVDLASVRLNDVPAQVRRAHDDEPDDDDLSGGASSWGLSTPFDRDDDDEHGRHRRRIKLRFDRAAVLATLPDSGLGELTLLGALSDGNRFLARDTVTVGGDCDDDRDAVAGGGSAAAAVVATPERASLRLGPNPMLASGALQLELTLARAGRTEVQVYSLDGRLVRELAAGERPPGVHALAWDGRDRAGRTAPAGVYLVRVRAPGLTMSKRVVRVR